MICPKCGAPGDKPVVRTEPRAEAHTIYRRRECPDCKTRFNTNERAVRVVKVEVDGYSDDPPVAMAAAGAR